MAVVYFIQDSRSLEIKIGFTDRDASERLATLQTGNPHRLVLLLVIEGGRDDEAWLHQKFKAARGTGEWFRPTNDLLTYLFGFVSESNYERGWWDGREAGIEVRDAAHRYAMKAQVGHI